MGGKDGSGASQRHGQRASSASTWFWQRQAPNVIRNHLR